MRIACVSSQRRREWERQYRERNRERIKQNQARHRARSPARGDYLFRRYGLTQEDYEQRLAAQGGGCDICGGPPGRGRGGKLRRYCVDHDHKTGRLRGLLCKDCNAALGHARDNPATLRQLADYVEKHR